MKNFSKTDEQNFMNLIFLYGPPAVGKYTIAKELANITGYKLFHNHLTADLVSSIFETGTLEYADLVVKIRLNVFEAAAKHHLPGLIFTFVHGIETHEGRRDDEFVKQLFKLVEQNRGRVFLIKLTCDQRVLEERLAHPSRKEFHKLHSIEALKNIQKDYNLTRTIPLGESFKIDTTRMSPVEVADKIKNHWNL